jgi:hypothetical protein
LKNNTLKQECSIFSTTYLKNYNLTMLHIRLTFIGIKTGWAPKLSAGPMKKKYLGAQLAPGEKMLSFVHDCSVTSIIHFTLRYTTGKATGCINVAHYF